MKFLSTFSFVDPLYKSQIEEMMKSFSISFEKSWLFRTSKQNVCIVIWDLCIQDNVGICMLLFPWEKISTAKLLNDLESIWILLVVTLTKVLPSRTARYLIFSHFNQNLRLSLLHVLSMWWNKLNMIDFFLFYIQWSYLISVQTSNSQISNSQSICLNFQ